MRLGFVALIIIPSSFALASVPSVSSPKVEKVLLTHSEKKFSELKKMGPKVYSQLKSLAFDERRPLGLRWQSFMAMARLGEKESLPEVELALKNKDWFMRSAALRVLPVIDEEKAFAEALKALDDKALVVRSQAVDTLARLKNPKCVPRLWQELKSKSNYLHNQSLWIRKKIISTLAELSPQGSEENFIKALADADASLYEPAIRGLERVTGQSLGHQGMHPNFKRHLWQKWYQAKSKKSDIPNAG